MLRSEAIGRDEHPSAARAGDVAGGLAPRVRRRDHVAAAVEIDDGADRPDAVGNCPEPLQLGDVLVADTRRHGGQVLLMLTRLRWSASVISSGFGADRRNSFSLNACALGATDPPYLQRWKVIKQDTHRPASVPKVDLPRGLQSAS
jgi:hypothetical protein